MFSSASRFSRMTLMQRNVLRWRWRALKTSPIPPAPSRFRISYLPSSTIPDPILDDPNGRALSLGIDFPLTRRKKDNPLRMHANHEMHTPLNFYHAHQPWSGNSAAVYALLPTMDCSHGNKFTNHAIHGCHSRAPSLDWS